MPTLQNLIEQAFEVGQQTGKARKENDESRAKFHKDWFNRFKSLNSDYQKQLGDAFDNGYRAGRGTVGVR